MAEEAGELETAAAWVDKGYSVAHSLAGWWPMIAGAAGFFMPRKRGGWVKSVGRIWSLWRLGKQFAPIWRRFGHQGQRPGGSVED